MVEVKRTLRIITHQEISGKPGGQENAPMRDWSVELRLLDENGEPKPAKVFQRVVYNLHPTFEIKTMTYTSPPFKCENEGWGSFDMRIDMYTSEKGGKQMVTHDLNFLKDDYHVDTEIKFKNPNAALLNLLRETGPVPGDENGARKKADGDKKRKRATGGVDMEKLADAMVKLNEDDLLHVVQIIHDHKSEDTYTKNDIDQGEFHVDLYTLPEPALRMLWDYVQSAKAS